MTKLANALVLSAGLAFGGNALACGDGSCNPKPPVTPTPTPTAEAEANANAAAEANSASNATATGGAGGAGGAGGNASIAEGAVQNTITTNYKAAAASAVSAGAGNTGHDCFRGRGGVSVGAQTVAGGASVTLGGGEAEYDLENCHKAKVELSIVNKGGNAVDSTAALLTAAGISAAVGNAVEDLTSPKGAKLIGLFAIPAAAPVAAPASVTPVQPIVNTYITTVAPAEPAKAENKTCPPRTHAVYNVTTGQTVCAPQ